MRIWTFCVSEEPQGKARPRFARTRNGVRTYTPNKTMSYEQRVQLAYRGKYKEEPTEKPVSVYIQANFKIPKSWSKKKKEQVALGVYRPTKKPDADNIAKAVCDALNGIAYKDDSQIVHLVVDKFYSDGDGYVMVKIEEME